MTEIVLTAYSGSILGPIAKVLGLVMDALYVFMQNVFGIESAALAIVLLTIVIYMAMLPLTYQQQKFAKLSKSMQPELQKIQAKYKGRSDQEATMLMNQETQLVYKKYGVSPTGSCVQLIIQMPILFALYRVFYNIPAYIGTIKDTYATLANEVIATAGYQDKLLELMNEYKVITGSGVNVNNFMEKISGIEGSALTDYVIDVLYKLPTNAWESLNSVFPNASASIADTWSHIQKFNYFLGMNISDSPMTVMKDNFASKNFLFVILALMIPVLSYLSQVVSIKISMASNGQDQATDQMSQQMKSMNTMMPLMSLFLCFTVPVGLGLYWILSAVVRTAQMVVINKRLDSLDINKIIEANAEKAKAEMEKMGIRENQIRQAAAMKTRSIDSKSKTGNIDENAIANANARKANAKPGSMAAKANLVQKYNEKK